MIPLLNFLLRSDTEEVTSVASRTLVTQVLPLVGRGRDFPLLECHDAEQDILGELEVLFAVSAEVEFFRQSLDVQVLEAGLQQPLFQQEVRDDADGLVVADGLLAELVNSHLVDALAELADGVRDH